MCRMSDNWLTVHFHAYMSHWALCPIIEHIRQSDQCTFTCTHQVHVNVQWPEYLTCANKCAVSHTLGSLHIYMHISVTRLTPHLHEHIGEEHQFTFTCTHQEHVNVLQPVCLTCACKCAESHTIGSLYIFMRTSVIGPTGQLHERIRQSDHCTYTSIHQVHENVQWPKCLTSACKCAES